MKTLGIIAGAIVILLVGFFALNGFIYNEKQGDGGLVSDYKGVTFLISGEPVTLVNGVSEIPAPENGGASSTTVRYFGNEAEGDIDGDGDLDTVFLVTQEGGGSGTFFFLVGALHEEGGYRGSNAVFIGDRIAPQTTQALAGEVIVNYADRAPGEPFTAAPSVGKSLHLKYSPETNDFGELVQDFEGESAQGIRGVALLGPHCPVETYPPQAGCEDTPYKTRLALTTVDGARVIKEFETTADGSFRIEVVPGTYVVRSAAASNVLPYCASDGIIEVARGSFVEAHVSCDTGIR